MTVRRGGFSRDIFFCEGRKSIWKSMEIMGPRHSRCVWFIYLHLVNFCMVRGRFDYTID